MSAQTFYSVCSTNTNVYEAFDNKDDAVAYANRLKATRPDADAASVKVVECKEVKV